MRRWFSTPRNRLGASLVLLSISLANLAGEYGFIASAFLSTAGIAVLFGGTEETSA